MVVVKWLLSHRRDAVNLQYHKAALFQVKLEPFAVRHPSSDSLSFNKLSITSFNHSHGIDTGIYPTISAKILAFVRALAIELKRTAATSNMSAHRAGVFPRLHPIAASAAPTTVPNPANVHPDSLR